MYENIFELNNKFLEINRMGWIRSRRKGSTGIGYTFESLLGKNEDSLSLPDFKGIEIKTKLGYTKTPLTLFSLTGNNGRGTPIYKKFIYSYGYYRKDKPNYKSFSHELYVNKFVDLKYSIQWRLKIDYTNEKIKLLLFDSNLNIIDNNIYWDFNEIKKRLLTKLKYLALVKGYRYIKNNEIYYKYVSMTLYKLKGFKEFIKLMEKGIIFINFNISGYNVNVIIFFNSRKIEFRINNDAIDQLFDKLY